MREISDRHPAGLSHCIASIASNLFFLRCPVAVDGQGYREILAQGYNPVEWDWCIEIAELRRNQLFQAFQWLCVTQRMLICLSSGIGKLHTT